MFFYALYNDIERFEMSKKWLSFHTLSNPMADSPVSISTGDANIVADWRRLNWNKTYIDGRLLRTIMSERSIANEMRDDLTEANLKQFFEDVILQKVPDAQKAMISADLMRTFHQGGLLHPVTSASSFLFENSGFSPRGHGDSRDLNFVTHEQGFILQEIHTVREFAHEQDNLEVSIIRPDSGYDFCMQSQATIQVFFNPEMQNTFGTNLINSSMSYGSHVIQGIADQRAWYKKFIDFISYLLGFNSIENLSSIEATQSTSNRH
jgi:hypothetical protein